MTTRSRRWTIVGLVLLACVAVFVLAGLPYLPLVHGSDDDEVERLVDWLAIDEGSRIADFGAGDGRFAIALAGRVGPSGHVYATEISAEALDEIRAGAADAGIVSFTVIEGAADRTNLPVACCDAVFSRNVYHHLTDPDAINADLRRALRDGGRLLVIDFEPGGPLDRVSPPETSSRHGGHGTPKQTLIDEVTAAGFRLVRGPEPWRGRMYAVMFEQAGGR